MGINFFYKNNEEISIPINATGNLTGDPTMTIGGRKISSDGPFEGMIDDFRIYDQHLTSSQRNEIFNFDTPPLLLILAKNFLIKLKQLKVRRSIQ